MERRLAAIFAADIAGYSRLMEADEADTLARVRALQTDLLAPRIASHGGRVVKLMGDGLLAEFPSSVEAVRCAIAIQRGMADGTRHPGTPLALRIGVNLGDVIVEGDDIHGDGVNVAARLEALAEPGGICISGIAHESLRESLGVSFTDLGPQSLRNIDRPVRALAWHPGEGAAARPAARMPVLPDRPSIAVLPFTNMSGDTEQDYFSDGVTEDLITELSRFPELFVIARNSSFVFKGQAADVREVAKKLGVQFVVEGSVRRAARRVRVTAQLIDALSGAHVWADRFDRDLEDIFEVQDDVVRAIVAVLPGRIAAAGTSAARRKAGTNMTAYDNLLRGYHRIHQRGAALTEAIGHFRQAIEIDPDYGAAHAGLSLAEGMCIWDLSYFDDDPLGRALAAGKRAVELDPGDYMCHAAYGTALRQSGDPERARHHLDRARQMNPNSVRVMGYYAMLQGYSRTPEDALDTYARAVKLDPFSQKDLKPEILSEAYYNMRDYRASIRALEGMLELPIFYTHQQIAIAHAMLGEDEARDRHMALYRAGLPENYDEMRLFESHMLLCQFPEQEAHWREGYRRTGLDV